MVNSTFLKGVIMEFDKVEKRCLQLLTLLSRNGRTDFRRNEIIKELNIDDDIYDSFMRKTEGLLNIEVHGMGNIYEAFNIKQRGLLEAECEMQGVESCQKCNCWTKIEKTEKGKCETRYKVSEYAVENPELKNEHLETDAYDYCDSYKPITE